jgi:hypothetical protein
MPHPIFASDKHSRLSVPNSSHDQIPKQPILNDGKHGARLGCLYTSGVAVSPDSCVNIGKDVHWKNYSDGVIEWVQEPITVRGTKKGHRTAQVIIKLLAKYITPGPRAELKHRDDEESRSRRVLPLSEFGIKWPILIEGGFSEKVSICHTDKCIC